MKITKRMLSSKGFIKNIILLVSGTLLAQSVSIISSPILTRIYSPEAFGELGVFTSITSIFSVFMCLRYELALVIPKEKEYALALLCLSFSICCLITGNVALFILYSQKNIFKSFKINNSCLFALLFLIYIFSSGIFSICNYWYTREGKFKYLAIRQIVNTVLTIGIEIILSLFIAKNSGMGMILGYTLSLSITTLILFVNILKENYCDIKKITIKDIRKEAYKYREFPLFASWTALLNTLSFSLPSLMLSFFFNSNIVGYYSLAYKILDMPVSLVGGAVAQAFYPQINAQNTLEDKKNLTLKVVKTLLEIGLVPVILVGIAAPWIFTVFFGKECVTTGYYARLLSLWILAVFVGSPVSNLYVTMNRLKEGLCVNIIMLIVRFLSLVIGGYSGQPMFAIALFGGAGAIMWIFNSTYIMSFVDIRPKEVKELFLSIIKRKIKYLIFPVVSLFINNYIVLLISILCGIWFLLDLVKNIRDDVK